MLLFINYCIVSHMHNCKPTYAPPCVRVWRRARASRVWEIMSVCLMGGVWQVAEVGQEREGLVTVDLPSRVP